MLVYDVTDAKSAENVGYWIKNIKKHAAENVSLVLVGNKTDLLSELNSPACQAGREYAIKYKVDHQFTSAKDSVGVDDAFLSLVNSMMVADSSKVKVTTSSCPSYPGSANIGTPKPMQELGQTPTGKPGKNLGIFNKKEKGDNSGTSEKNGKDKCHIS